MPLTHVFVKVAGCEPTWARVNATTPVSALKDELNLCEVALWYGRKYLASSKTLLDQGVPDGATLNALKSTRASAAGQAAAKLARGTIKVSRMHPSLNKRLHEQTQSVVMEECRELGDRVDKVRTEHGGKLDQLLAYHEAKPQLNEESTDLMVMVLQTFRVARMDEILDEHGIDREKASKNAKANLIAKRLDYVLIRELLAKETAATRPTKKTKRQRQICACGKLAVDGDLCANCIPSASGACGSGPNHARRGMHQRMRRRLPRRLQHGLQ